jgi:putative transcriptional regulator
MLVNRVSRVMGDRRVSVAELARRAGISRPTASRLYHDAEDLNVSLDVLERVCEALDADLCELFERVPDAEASGADRGREPAGASAPDG